MRKETQIENNNKKKTRCCVHATHANVMNQQIFGFEIIDISYSLIAAYFDML